MIVRRSALALGLALGLALSLCLAASGARTRSVLWNESLASAPEPTTTKPPEPFTFAIGPADGTANLPITAEVDTKVTGGTITSVALTDEAGRAVAGELREDKTSWVPAQPLEHSRRYTATVTATAQRGETETKTTTFATMPRPGGSRVGSGLYVFTGNTYGTAMPVVVEFESAIPESARASATRRLFVKTDPPQPGRWHWHSAKMVLYRAENYWKPGTSITVRSALSGHPIGDRFGDMDRAATVKIADRSLVLDVDNATKQMNVLRDGQVIRTMPVSLGKPKTPSSSGHMVIMEKSESTIFDTTATDGPDGYRIRIDYAQRLTWGGEFVHSAPWSVRDQGVRNVSHGCVNVSADQALWLFQQTMVGDAVIVRGTERALQAGNGWTAWDIPWDRYGT
jgi:lipoprotein-anchoring transpeptidase ErfK/SrfK